MSGTGTRYISPKTKKACVAFFFFLFGRSRFFFFHFIHYFCGVFFSIVLFCEFFFLFFPVSPLVCVLAVSFWEASGDKRGHRERGVISQETFFRLPSFFTALACLLFERCPLLFSLTRTLLWWEGSFLTRSR